MKKFTIHYNPLNSFKGLHRKIGAIIGIILVIFLFLHYAVGTSAVWYDDSYLYREKLTIGNTGSAVADQKVKFDIDTATLITAGKMQSDCDDTRFTDINGKQLPYFLDSANGACNDSSTDYYVLVPTINAGNTDLYMYYGNPSASAGTQAAQFSQATFSPTSGPTVATEEQAPSPVLFWKFDDGTGSTAQDTTLQNNDGTTSGPTWQFDNMCVSDKCLSFDGSNDTVSKSYSSDTELNPGTGSVSVSTWFKHTSAISGTDTLIARVDGSSVNGVGYKVYMNSSGFMCFGIDDTAGSFPSDSACSSTSYADSKWHQLTAVKNGTTSITTYIDGVSIATDASLASTSSISGSSPTFYVGIDGNGTSNPWDGFADEVKVYPYLRSAAQVKLDYQRIMGIKGAGSTLGAASTAPLNQGLIGYWKMEQGSGNTPGDSSGNAIDLTPVNSSTLATGKLVNGVDLESGSSQYSFVADSAKISLTGSVTLAAWIKPESVTASTQFDIIGKWDGANESYLLAQYGDELQMYVDSSSNYVQTNAADLATGIWYHVVGTYNSTTATAKIYVNAVEQGTATTGTIPASIGDDAGRLQIGAEDSTTTAANFYDGVIDDVRLYSRALSGGEVLQLYTFAPGPNAYYKFDEKTGTTAIDSSTNANTTSAFTGNTTWTTGKFGSALTFDGVNDSAGRGQTTTLAVGATTDSYTVSAWIKTSTNFSSNAYIVAKSQEAASYPYILFLDSSEDACFKIHDGTNNPSVCGSTALNDGKWHYVTGVRDVFNDQLFIYVDSVLINSASDSTTATVKSNDAFVIGNGGVGSAQFDFNGVIDEVKLYQYARSQKQIIEDMLGGHSSVTSGGSNAGPAGYYKLDEGYGTTANDVSSNSNSLTLSAVSWTNNGKFGKAWDGNGAKWMSRADDADFDFIATEDWAVSLWFKSDSATNPGATEYLVDKESSSAGYAVYANTDGTICFGIDDDATWNPDIASCTTGDFYDGTWHHIVGVRDYGLTDKTYIYIDGVQKDSDADSTTATFANSASLVIGDRDATDNGDEFTGDIDEVKIYRAALAPNDIKTEYNRSSSMVLGALSDNSSYQSQAANQEYCVPGDSTSCAAPVGEWNFDEGTGTSAQDTSGNAVTGTLSTPTYTVGKIGKALNFNGSTDNVTFATTISGVKTVSFWVNPATTTQSFLDLDGGTHYISASSGTVSATGFTSPTIYVNGVSGATITANTWNHIEVTTGTSFNTTSSMTFGKQGSNFLNGKLDQIRLFNYARSGPQVAWDYNRGGPTAWYKLDECTGSTTYDASGNAYNGTLTIGSSGSQTTAGTCPSATSTEAWSNGTVGKFNASLKFDGTDDYISVTDTANLRFDAATADFSLFAWVKRTTTGTEYIISKEDADDDGYRLQFNSSNQVLCSEDATDVTSTSTITDTSWHLVGCTIDRDGNGQVYIDGLANGSTAAMGTDAMATTTAMTIGTRSYTATSYLNGQIDDVRIYNYVLTGAQVKNLYNGGAAVRFGPASGQP